jgi:hypothetical protein
MLLKHSDEVYPHRKDINAHVWVCEDYFKGCSTSVGAFDTEGHPPKGKPADIFLRQQRMLAHDHIDWIWKDRLIPRRKMYLFLSSFMGLTIKDCHIGLFDEEQCCLVMSFGNLVRTMKNVLS